MKVIHFYIGEHLKQFKSEILYIIEIINQRINANLILKDGVPEEVSLTYGISGGSLEIKESFFSECLDFSTSGLVLKKKPMLYKQNHQLGEVYSLNNNNHFSQNRIIHSDIIGLFFLLLSRIEERTGKRDSANRFHYQSSLAYQYKFLDRPILNEVLDSLVFELKKTWNFIELIKKKEIHITHDVDRLRSYHSFFSEIKEGAGDLLKKRSSAKASFKKMISPFTNREPGLSFDYLLNLSEKYNLKSTFFFMAPSNHPIDSNYATSFKGDLIHVFEEICKRDHKFGLHGGFGTYNDKELFSKHKNDLENILACKITKTRQHNLRWSTETPKIQSESGIKEDYTLAYPQDLSFRSSYTYGYNAYCLGTRKALDLTLYPTSIMDFTLFIDKYVSFSPDDAYSKISNCNDIFNKYGGDLCTLFHTVAVMKMTQEYEKTLEILTS
jgi:hypothetical protein